MSHGKPNQAELLRTLILNELSNLPIENWGFFFPVFVALWRFIEELRPHTLGTIRAGFDTEPYFHGPRARWFVDSLAHDERILGAAEKIMYGVVDALGSALMGRDSISVREVPPIDDALLFELAEATLAFVDDALRRGILTQDAH